mgnify:CR=1 FL=1
MKSREAVLKPKRFLVAEKSRKAADLEAMIREFEGMADELGRQIHVEEERTGVRDVSHFNYSTFAKSAAARRDKLLASVADLRAKLEAANAEYLAAVDELRLLEADDARDGESGSIAKTRFERANYSLGQN